MKSCRNLRFDKNRNEFFCSSIHVCYKSVCREGDLFNLPIVLSPAKLK